jgi:lipopolysaccharide export system protein LptA
VAHFYYSKATKNLDRIVLKNGVEFIESDRKGSCSELEMNLVENKMTMRGQPKVQQGEDEISGQEIIFIDGGKKVKINKTSKTRF